MQSRPDISQPVIGMNTDSTLDNKGYSFALNASIEDSSGNGIPILQNTESNLLASWFDEGYQVIGKPLEIHEQNRVLFFLVNPETGISQIAEIIECDYNDESDDVDSLSACQDCPVPDKTLGTPLEQITQQPYCSAHTIVSSDCLNFNIDYPVDSEYRVTDCGVNVYFTDNFNDRRFIYFKYADGDSRGKLAVEDRFKVITGYTSGDCTQPIYGDEVDCNKIKYHTIHSSPCISDLEVVSGGSLKAGVYQVMVCYADVESNPLTSYYPASQPIPVFTKAGTVLTDYETDKAIAISIEGLDINTIYQYYNIVVAETIDNFTSFKLAVTLPVTRSRYIYTGDDKTIPVLTPEDVFFKRPYYKTAASVTKSNNYLFFADVKEYTKPNLQRAANEVKVRWQTVAIPESVYSDPENSWRYRSYLRDEVYALALVYIFDTGEETCGYHIPGRIATEFDRRIINNFDAMIDKSCFVTSTKTASYRRQRWQVYNTASITATPHTINKACEDTKCWESGEMAYWESKDEYPNDPVVWGDLCGKPIRHHKMPDSYVTHIHDGLNENRTFKQTNLVFPLGIQIDHQSVKNGLDKMVTDGIMSSEDRARIVGYRVVRGNRVGNKSIIARGLLFDMWKYNKKNQDYYYPNYPYNDLRPDRFIAPNDNTYDGGNNSSPTPSYFTKSSRYTFHSPDIHFTNPTLGTELQFETEEYGQSEGFFNIAEDEARYSLLSTFASSFIFAAGMSAALSSLASKECTDYTTKAPSVEAGLAGGVTTYNYNPFFPTQQTNNLPNPLEFKMVSEVKRTTCKGTPFQTMSPLSFSVRNPFAAFVSLVNVVGGFLNQAMYFLIIGMREMEVIKDLVESLMPPRKMGIQYNSVGRYNNYKKVEPTGFKVRPIVKSAYLAPGMQDISETSSTEVFTNTFVNNWNRESSVYIKTDPTLPVPSITAVVDDSRGTMEEFGLGYNDLEKTVYRNIGSYYATIKNYVPDQYGNIYKIDYLETNGCVYELDKEYGMCNHIFGGDTFINRFALKRKMPFFLQTRFRALDNSDVKFSELGNVGFPNYYFNTHESILEKMEDSGILKTLTRVRDLVGAPRTRLDTKKNSLFEQKGYIHLYNYGIPYFLVESDVNVDYRHAEDNKDKDFYPHQQNLNFWLQQKNVPISEDNYYTYNRTYSKQNHESVICINQASFDNRECKVAHPNRVIYYDETNSSQLVDNWIISKANNFYDFPLSSGRLVSVDGIENDKVLVRFENGVQVFNAYDTLKTEGGSVQLGSGGIFATRPQEFASTDLGYAGTQHREILHTEFGHIMVDARRGQVFNLASNASGLDDLSKDGMKNWFKENLPFQIFKSFPNMSQSDIDNTYKNIGITMAYDKRYHRFFLTKRDFKPLKTDLKYDPLNKEFFYRTEDTTKVVVSLNDKRYFCDRSWTISYNFLTKSWVSYHSFIPNYYINHIEYFQSGLNSSKSSVWSHNLTNKSYQVYYGKLYPFTVETLSGKTIGQNFTNYIEFALDVVRYHNKFDYSYNPLITFNEAIVYNQRQCSGLLELIPRNLDDLSEFGKYPQVTQTGIKIHIDNSQNLWRFNDFWNNVSQAVNMPVWNYACNNVDKTLNPRAFNFTEGEQINAAIRSDQTRVRLSNTKDSQHKFIFKYLVYNQNNSIR